MVHGLVLCAVLVGVGVIPVLPAFLGIWKDSESGAFRWLVRAVALFFLWLCFNLSWLGAAISFASWISGGSGLAIIPSVFFLQLPALWFSYRVAFGREPEPLEGRKS